MTRRTFLRSLLASGAVGLLARCAASTSAAKCPTGDAATTYTNPGHAHTTVNLTSAQVNAKAAGSYQVLTGDHFHSVTFSADDFDALVAGATVEKTVLSDGHILTFKRC